MAGITPFTSGGDGPGCFTGALQAPSAGVRVTVVIVRGAHRCVDPAGEHMGVVFYGIDPVMWSCLSDADIPSFKTWSAGNFAGVQPFAVTSPLPAINCPPSITAQPATMVAMRAELTKLGPAWLAQAAQAQPAA